VTKPNPENCKNCSSTCAYNCAQLQYTIQHRTFLTVDGTEHNLRTESNQEVEWKGKTAHSNRGQVSLHAAPSQ